MYNCDSYVNPVFLSVKEFRIIYKQRGGAKLLFIVTIFVSTIIQQ